MNAYFYQIKLILMDEDYCELGRDGLCFFGKQRFRSSQLLLTCLTVFVSLCDFVKAMLCSHISAVTMGTEAMLETI